MLDAPGDALRPSDTHIGRFKGQGQTVGARGVADFDPLHVNGYRNTQKIPGTKIPFIYQNIGKIV